MIGFVIAQKMGKAFVIEQHTPITLTAIPPLFGNKLLIAPQGSFIFRTATPVGIRSPTVYPGTVGHIGLIFKISFGRIRLAITTDPSFFRSPLPLEYTDKRYFSIQFCRKFTNFQIGIIGYKTTAVSHTVRLRSHRCHITALQLKRADPIVL